MKIFIGLIIFLVFIYSFAYPADNVTEHYRMLIPEQGSVNWLAKISNDIVSIDAVMNMMSEDLALTSTKIIVSRDGVSTVGGAVGRISVVSADGTSSFILLYAGK